MIDPLYPFVLAGLLTPGPNVILVTASGARFGLRRTWPHILGIAAGVAVTSAVTALGIGALLLALPALEWALKLLSAAWIGWMAWTLARSTAAAREIRHPWGFGRAVLFQWVNPKVWAVALAASSGFASDLPPAGEALRIASAFGGINLAVCTFWTLAGTLLALLLTTPAAWRVFTLVMAAALAASAGMIFLV